MPIADGAVPVESSYLGHLGKSQSCSTMLVMYVSRIKAVHYREGLATTAG